MFDPHRSIGLSNHPHKAEAPRLGLADNGTAAERTTTAPAARPQRPTTAPNGRVEQPAQQPGASLGGVPRTTVTAPGLVRRWVRPLTVRPRPQDLDRHIR